MLFILKMMVNEKHIKEILPKIGFDHFDFVTPINHSGGIAILWNNGTMHASVLREETRAIHMLVYDTIKACNSIIR